MVSDLFDPDDYIKSHLLEHSGYLEKINPFLFLEVFGKEGRKRGYPLCDKN